MVQRGLWVLVMVLILIVAACGSSEDEAERERDSALPNFSRQTDLALTALFETATARASITPSSTPPVITATLDPRFLVTFTPIPTVFTQDRDDFLGNAFPQQAWLNQPFITTDGVEYALDNFSGSLIVVRILDTDCGNDCMLVQMRLREVATENSEPDASRNVTFVMLNTNTTISNRSLNVWATENGFPHDPDLNWYVGTVSPFLQRDLVATFGEAVVVSSNLSLIVVDLDGVSHLAQGETYSKSRLNAIIGSYLSSEADEETPEPDEAENEPDAAPSTPLSATSQPQADDDGIASE